MAQDYAGRTGSEPGAAWAIQLLGRFFAPYGVLQQCRHLRRMRRQGGAQEEEPAPPALRGLVLGHLGREVVTNQALENRAGTRKEADPQPGTGFGALQVGVRSATPLAGARGPARTGEALLSLLKIDPPMDSTTYGTCDPSN